ncbi:hypothetical protein PO002_41075 [Cupriavidus necator]
MAQLIIYAIRGFTEVADDSESMAGMIQTQVRLVVSALDQND